MNEKHIAPRRILEIDFYRAHYPDLSGLSDAELRAHWQRHGEEEGRLAHPEEALTALRRHPELPADFDLRAYLELNPDVAQASRWDYQAIEHFLQFGAYEGRSYRFDGTTPKHNGTKSALFRVGGKKNMATRLNGISHFFGRRGNPAAVSATPAAAAPYERDKWQEFLRTLKKREAIEAFCRRHPNAGALDRGFSLASYLFRNRDVADSLDKPIFGVFHYLEFGLAEARTALPEVFDRRFVAEFHGVETVEGADAEDVLVAVRVAHGLTPFDLIPLDEPEFVFHHGLCDFQFLEMFDHEYYRAVALGEERASENRARCLEHFLREGRHVPYDISADQIFDPEFYAREYVLASGSTADGGSNAAPTKPWLFNDWLTRGLAEGHAPNLDSWILRNYGLKAPQSIKAHLLPYRCNAEGLTASSSSIDVVRHMIERADPALHGLAVIDRPSADFVAAIADRQSSFGNMQAADRLYFFVLGRFPDHGQALRHRADQVQRADLIGVAADMRRKIIDAKAHNVWSFITLADCLRRLGDDLSAAAVMREGAETYPGDVGAKTLARDLARKAFDSLWSSAPSLALDQGVETVQGMLRRALDLCTPAFEAPRSRRAIRSVAIVGNGDIPQCKFYRIDQKIEHLLSAGYSVETFDFNTDIDVYLKRLNRFDATIFYRVPAFPSVIEAITKTTEYGIATFYEVDDLIFDTEHFPPSFKSYAGQITYDHYVAMACGVPLFDHAMRLCEYGLASTPALQELMSERVKSGKAFLHRNAFGRVHEEAMRMTQARRGAPSCTIFYGSGTKAHKEDFHNLLEPALVEIAHKYGDAVRVVIVGDLTLSEALRSLANVVVLQPNWSVEDYYLNLLSQADINLSVLEPSLMSDCKSEIKWLEAAMFGIPSVVSRTRTFEDTITHGETGYLCRTSGEFTEAIDRLVGDPVLRAAIGSAARDVALKHYSIAAQGGNIRSILESVSRSDPSKPRILIVNVFYAPQSIGGATRVVEDNVKELVTQFGDTFEITVLCSLEGGTTPYEIGHYCHHGVRIFTITAPSEADIDKKAIDAKMEEAFSTCLDVIEPNVIHFHCVQRLTASVVEAARRRRIPYFITAHDGWWISPNQFLVGEDDTVELYDFRLGSFLNESAGARDLARQTALRKPLIGAEKIFAVSREFAAIYESTGLTNVVVVENGLSMLPRGARADRISGPVRLAHIGGASRHKGFHLVKHALCTGVFEHLQLLVIDHGLPKGALRHEIWGQTPVTISAKVDPRRIEELYSQIDVLLAPSLWPESYGLVTREALAAGCWVVASDRGAIGACVEEGVNGFRVDVGNHLGLTRVLREIDRSPLRFIRSPPSSATLRRSAEQAEDLAKWYTALAPG